jgi:hypothetical protein
MAMGHAIRHGGPWEMGEEEALKTEEGKLRLRAARCAVTGHVAQERIHSRTKPQLLWVY